MRSSFIYLLFSEVNTREERRCNRQAVHCDVTCHQGPQSPVRGQGSSVTRNQGSPVRGCICLSGATAYLSWSAFLCQGASSPVKDQRSPVRGPTHLSGAKVHPSGAMFTCEGPRFICHGPHLPVKNQGSPIRGCLHLSGAAFTCKEPRFI